MKTLTRLPALAGLLLSLALLAPAAPAAAQSCPAGVSGVSVELLPASAADGSKERREHAFLSTSLASALGLTGRIDPTEDINPQIRVTVDAPSNSGEQVVSTANFTVAGTFSASGDTLRVYRQENPGDDDDEDAGEWKLLVDYPDSATPTASQLSVTVHAFPASTSTLVEGGSTTTHVGLCEPSDNSDDGDFTETAEIASSGKELVILAPHGGDIEEGTSEMADTIVATLDTRGYDADLWKAEGSWELSDASERWHITSGALDEASWPALEEIFDQVDYETDLPYLYALSLHGFGWSGPDRYGVIVGGQSPYFAKCYIVRKSRQALAAIPLPGGGTVDRSGEVSFFVFDHDDYNHSFPNNKGQRIEAERGIRSLRGMDSDNIVNRLSPNPDGERTRHPAGDPFGVLGHGGIQLELSNDLRDDDQLRDAVATAAAEALADILDGTATSHAGTGCHHIVDSATPVTADVGLLSGGAGNPTLRREEARISTALAAELGIAGDDLDPDENGGIYPQIRVAVTAPVRTDGSLNEGVFTVTGQFTLGVNRVDVHPEAFAGDTDSGEHKLLADLTAGTVEAAVYRQPIGRSFLDYLEDDGDTDGSIRVVAYDEPNTNVPVAFNELGRLVEDREAIVLAPHNDLGPAFFEDLLFGQAYDIVARMEADDVYASRWTTVGKWLFGDAFSAWHVDDTFHSTSSFPALAELMADEHGATGKPFGRALSIAVFDGFDRDVIVGGQGDRSEKCYLVEGMQAALTAAGHGGEVAFYVVDGGGDVSVPDGAGDQIPSSTAERHAGGDDLKLVNRLGADSFLVTESDTVRDDDDLRDAVSDGLGAALAELVATGVPAGFSCSSL